jgi:hypothetical protein
MTPTGNAIVAVAIVAFILFCIVAATLAINALVVR